MIKLTQKDQKIINIFLKKGTMRSSNVRSEMVKSGEDISLITVKRALSNMASEGILIILGSGRSTSYNVTLAGRILADIDARKYCSIEPDKRYGLNNYNFDIETLILFH